MRKRSQCGAIDGAYIIRRQLAGMVLKHHGRNLETVFRHPVNVLLLHALLGQSAVQIDAFKKTAYSVRAVGGFFSAQQFGNGSELSGAADRVCS